jgi:hypothetical protein
MMNFRNRFVDFHSSFVFHHIGDFSIANQCVLNLRYMWGWSNIYKDDPGKTSTWNSS